VNELPATVPRSLSAASIGRVKYLAHSYVHGDADSLPCMHVIQRGPFRRRPATGSARAGTGAVAGGGADGRGNDHHNAHRDDDNPAPDDDGGEQYRQGHL
jgi:hypothetical protein